MRLDFCLLVVDDNPESVNGAIAGLSDYLETKGFTLRTTVADDLSEDALRRLARNSGKDFNLVMVDYNLGRTDMNGAVAAARMRHQLQFTDMIFYSTDPSVDLLKELASRHVAGVFVADRLSLGDALKGLAETVIGKAIDLSHMRGIAMAEVADMDVQMEEVLERVFASNHDCFAEKAARTLMRLGESTEKHASNVKKLVDSGEIGPVVTDPRVFSSIQKYHALVRVAGCLSEKPAEALKTLESYEAEVINNRNTLAHSKEDVAPDGAVSLRGIRKGKDPVSIDEAWMTDFRGKLRSQRNALNAVCRALDRRLEMLAAAEEGQKAKT